MDAENNEMSRDKFAAVLLEQMRKWIAEGEINGEAIDKLDGAELFGGILFAMHILYQQATGDEQSDLLDFTHIMNRLATGIIVEGVAESIRNESE